MLAIPIDTEALVRLVARKTGKTPEDVVRDAVEVSARSAGVTANEAENLDRDAKIEAATAIVRRFAGKPLLDTRTEDEILGYNDHGIPG